MRREETEEKRRTQKLLGKTHAVVGIAATLAVTRPETLPELVLAVGIGGVGAVISDVDVDTSEAHRGADKVIFLTVIFAAAVWVLDYFGQMGIAARIAGNGDVLRAMSGFLMFLAVCAFGRVQPHRSFMHSFLAMGLLSFALMLVLPSAVVYFVTGFASHLLTDIFNYKKVQIFYPLKKGVALKIFHAHGLANSILWLAGCVASGIELVQFLLNIF